MVFCPLVNKEVSDDDCFLTALVIEGSTPKADAMPGALDAPDHEKICLACENHPD